LKGGRKGKITALCEEETKRTVDYGAYSISQSSLYV